MRHYRAVVDFYDAYEGPGMTIEDRAEAMLYYGEKHTDNTMNVSGVQEIPYEGETDEF